MTHPGLTPLTQNRESNAKITTITENSSYGLYVRRTYIRGQWHIEIIRHIPEYADPMITELFLSGEEVELLRESLK